MEQPRVLKEKQIVGGKLREAGEDVSDASSIELAVLEAQDKLVRESVEEVAQEELPAIIEELPNSSSKTKNKE